MNLDQLEELLTRLEPDDIRSKYAQELEENPECEAMLRAFEAVDLHLDALKHLEPAPEFKQPPRKIFYPWLYAALPVAAILLLALLLGKPGILNPWEAVDLSVSKTARKAPSSPEFAGREILDTEPGAQTETLAEEKLAEVIPQDDAPLMEQKTEVASRLEVDTESARPLLSDDGQSQGDAAKRKTLERGARQDVAKVIPPAEPMVSEAEEDLDFENPVAEPVPAPKPARAGSSAIEDVAQMDRKNQAQKRLAPSAETSVARVRSSTESFDTLAESATSGMRPAEVAEWLAELRKVKDEAGFAALFAINARLRMVETEGYRDVSMEDLYGAWSRRRPDWEKMFFEDLNSQTERITRVTLPENGSSRNQATILRLVLNDDGLCKAMDFQVR